MKALKKISFLLSFALLATTCAFAVNTDKKADADTLWKGTATGYTKPGDFVYTKTGKYVHNWGARDEECVFLTSYAEDFYTGSYTFDNLSAKSGGSSQSNAPQSALYDALQDMMSAKQSHQTSYGETRYQYCYTDCVNSNSSYISSFYSAKRIKGTWDGGDTWNREHTWPNSKGDASGNGENDIMMLRPASVSENSSRGNKAYGQGSGYYDPNGEGQNVRGDCARIMLYVYTRWGNTGSMWGSSGVIQSLDVLLDWMEEDPVDTWEMGRNDAVQSITGTRNVFVDYPEYAWLLFGRDIPENMCTPSGIASNGEYVPNPDNSGSSSSTPEDSSTPDDEMTPTEIVNALYALSSGESLTGSYTLTGVITKVDSYTNPTIVVDGMTNKPVYCYKLKDDRFAVGDTITVTATTLKNYDGTYELMNCTLDKYVAGGTQTPDDSSSSVPDDDNSSSYVPDDDSSSALENNSSSAKPEVSSPDKDSSSVKPEVSSPDNDDSSSKNPVISSSEKDDSSSQSSDDNEHDFSKWMTVKKPTETKKGQEMRTCYKCGHTETRDIPALGGEAESGCESSIGLSFSAIVLAAGACLLLKKSKKQD